MLKRLTQISFSCFLVAIFSLQGEAKTTSKITDLDLDRNLANFSNGSITNLNRDRGSDFAGGTFPIMVIVAGYVPITSAAILNN